MAVKDIKLTENNDLAIQNGDFIAIESDVQHVNDIIEASEGHYKQFPLLGVGIENYLNSNGKEQQLNNSIKVNLKSDNYDVNKIDIITDNGVVNSTTQIYVDASRISL